MTSNSREQTTRPEFIAYAVARAKDEIQADTAAGVVPACVRDFRTLHDYVDANEYGGMCDPALRPTIDRVFPNHASRHPDKDDTVAALNEIQEQLDTWLQAGRPA